MIRLRILAFLFVCCIVFFLENAICMSDLVTQCFFAENFYNRPYEVTLIDDLDSKISSSKSTNTWTMKIIIPMLFNQIVQNCYYFMSFLQDFGCSNLNISVGGFTKQKLVILPSYKKFSKDTYSGKATENYMDALLYDFRKHFAVNLDCIDERIDPTFKTNVIKVNKHFYCDLRVYDYYSYWFSRPLINIPKELINSDIRSTIFVNFKDMHGLDCLFDNVISYYIKFRFITKQIAETEDDKEFAQLCSDRIDVLLNLYLHVKHILIRCGSNVDDFRCGMVVYNQANVAYKMYFANPAKKATTIKNLPSCN